MTVKYRVVSTCGMVGGCRCCVSCKNSKSPSPAGRTTVLGHCSETEQRDPPQGWPTGRRGGDPDGVFQFNTREVTASYTQVMESGKQH